MYFKFAGLLLAGFLVSPTAFTKEIVYECSVDQNTYHPEDQIPINDFETLPTKEQLFQDPDLNKAIFIPGKQKAKKGLYLQLRGGMELLVFKYEPKHALKDLLVVRLVHPRTKQMVYQVLPIGIPKFRLIYGGKHTEKKGVYSKENKMNEFYVSCHLEKFTHRVENALIRDKKVEPSKDTFDLSLDLGMYTEEYKESYDDDNHDPLPTPNPYSYNPQLSKPYDLLNEAGQVLLQFFFNKIPVEEGKRISHSIDIGDWMGLGQRWLFEFPDYLVDPETLEPLEKRLPFIFFQMVYPALQFENKKGYWMYFKDVSGDRTVAKAGVDPEDKLAMQTFIQNYR